MKAYVKTNALLLCGAMAGPLFLIIIVIEGAMRPDYNSFLFPLNYSTVTGYTMIVTFIITSMGFKQLPGFLNYAGLLQRLCISIGLTWITMLSLYFSTYSFFVALTQSKKAKTITPPESKTYIM